MQRGCFGYRQSVCTVNTPDVVPVFFTVVVGWVHDDVCLPCHRRYEERVYYDGSIAANASDQPCIAGPDGYCDLTFDIPVNLFTPIQVFYKVEGFEQNRASYKNSFVQGTCTATHTHTWRANGMGGGARSLSAVDVDVHIRVVRCECVWGLRRAWSIITGQYQGTAGAVTLEKDLVLCTTNATLVSPPAATAGGASLDELDNRTQFYPCGLVSTNIFQVGGQASNQRATNRCVSASHAIVQRHSACEVNVAVTDVY